MAVHRLALLILTLFVFTEISARAGGGGSYRSSSGSSSSSRSSSSSSGRSSSSSYSSSSSSSSPYRSYGSSSGRSSSGSYSGHSGPTYTALSGIKSIRREFDFSPAAVNPGDKIGIVETITFTYTGLSSNGFEYVPATPNGPWSFFTSHEYDKAVIQLVEPAKNAFRFKIVNPVVGKEYALRFSYVVSVAGTPSPDGVIYDFFPYCLVTDCVQKFFNLPGEARMDFYRQDKDSEIPAKLMKSSTGERFELAFADLEGTRFMRLLLKGEELRAAAQNAWSTASVVTNHSTNLRLNRDSTVHQQTDIEYVKGERASVISVAHGPGTANGFLYRDVENVESAYIRSYSDSSLRLRSGSKRFAFELLGAVTHSSGSHALVRIPVSPVMDHGFDVTRPQVAKEFIATHRAIDIEVPENFKVEPSLWECKNYSYGKCGIFRPIASQVTKRDRTLRLLPEESQVTGLWWLEIKVVEGKFEEPGLMTKLRFAFGNYRLTGDEPRWIFWFWLCVLLVGLISAITIFVLLGRLKHRRLEERKLRELEAAVLKDLQKRDPDFNAERFKARCRSIAERIQQAWSQGDMRSCRRFLSQGVYNRFRLQLQIQRHIEQRQNAMADFKIERFTLVERRRSGEFDALIVRLDAAARDAMVSAKLSAEEAQVAARKAPLAAFTEFYTFMRRRNAKSEAKHEANLDACVHCGAPFAAEGETTRCRSCGAVMGSGTFDWVLAEITQAVEFNANARKRKLPEGMSPDRIEDRASFLFWRDLMARMTGKQEYIMRDAEAAYVKKLAQEPQWSDIAVGAADIEELDDSGEKLKSTVRIKWSALSPGEKASRHRESILTLVATRDAAQAGFAEHSCPSCGAPLPETDSTECSYCRSTIARQNSDWLLTDVETSVE